jgi:chromosome segregation ATPase
MFCVHLFQLESARANESSQAELILTLQTRVQALETEIQGAKENLDTLRAANESAEAASAEAALEHDALIKAREALDALRAKTEALETDNAQVHEKTSLQLQQLESSTARVETLEAELAQLRKEKEDNASKLSELEIEILELKESQEASEDERGQLTAKIKSLENELSKAIVETQQSNIDAKGKEAEHVNAVEALKVEHESALKAAKDELASVVARLEALQTDLTEAHTAHAQAKADAQVAEEEHARKREELEKVHLGLQDKLSEDIKRITAELEVCKTLPVFLFTSFYIFGV